MDKQIVIQTLKGHQAELQELGVDHLALFGSVARDEAGPDSDVDLLATFNKSKALSLLKVVGIQRKISEMLGCPVDLGEKGFVKPRVQPYVEQDLIDVF
jgi:predicted nucleotidyltransferase